MDHGHDAGASPQPARHALPCRQPAASDDPDGDGEIQRPCLSDVPAGEGRGAEHPQGRIGVSGLFLEGVPSS